MNKNTITIWLSPIFSFNRWREAAQESIKHGGEGVVIKNLSSTYHYSELGEREPKPSNTWWKWKPKEKAQTDDFVVYGLFRTEKGTLMVEYGQYHEGNLFKVGKIDSFGEDVEKRILQLFKKGEFVIELGFEERTADGRLRHPSFIRIREDKDPKNVDLPPEFIKTLGMVDEKIEETLNRLLSIDSISCIKERLDICLGDEDDSQRSMCRTNCRKF